jgi:hypothetical protein
MQEAQARPADFKERFDVFVARAEEYLEVVRPFIPALVKFLPGHMGCFGDREVSGTDELTTIGNEAISTLQTN